MLKKTLCIILGTFGIRFATINKMGDVSPFFTPTLLSVILTEKVSRRLVL